MMNWRRTPVRLAVVALVVILTVLNNNGIAHAASVAGEGLTTGDHESQSGGTADAADSVGINLQSLTPTEGRTGGRVRNAAVEGADVDVDSAVIAASTLARRDTAANYPQCTTLQDHLTSYQALIQDIEADIDAAVVVAQDIVNINDEVTSAEENVCGLMHALTGIIDLSKVLGKLPYVGEVIVAISTAASAVLPLSKTMCSALGDLESIVKQPAEAAGEIVDGADSIKEKLDVISDYCGTAITLVDRAELVGSQICSLPLDAGCGSVVTALAASEAVVTDAAQKIQAVIAAAPEVSNLASTVSSLSKKANDVLQPLQDVISVFNTLTPYLDYIPSCTPAVPSECENVPYPCGVTWPCCGKLFGRCVCKYPNPKICYSNVCTPYIPPICTPSLDKLLQSLGISVPGLPGLDFLNIDVPDFPTIGFPESLLTLSIGLPTCVLG